MATQQTPAPTDPYKKFKDITAILSEQLPEHGSELERRAVFAWTDHVRANPGAEGGGMGELIYDTAATYTRDTFFGGTTPTNTNAARVLDGAIRRSIGLDRSALEDALKGEAKIDPREILEVMKTPQKGLGELSGQIVQESLHNLDSADHAGFRDYVVSLATEMGRTRPNASDMPTHGEAMRVFFEDVLPAHQKYQAAQRAAQSTDKQYK